MALDEAILQALADQPAARPTLRFFRWQPPCLSLGYSQSWHDLDETACRRLGYTWTRRPTGGKAILHIDEATYSLIIPQADPYVQGGILESYRLLSLGLLRGLELLGVQANQAPRPEKSNRAAGPVCFDTPSHYEITWQGKKLIGSAQLRRRQIVLQHGSLPLYGELNRIIDVLNFSAAERRQQRQLLPGRAVTLEQVLGYRPAFEAVVRAMIQGFTEQLRVELVPDEPTPYEQELAAQLRAEQYANEDWKKRL